MCISMYSIRITFLHQNGYRYRRYLYANLQPKIRLRSQNSESDQGADPTGSGYATLLRTVYTTVQKVLTFLLKFGEDNLI
jgi:hypothetical protein